MEAGERRQESDLRREYGRGSKAKAKVVATRGGRTKGEGARRLAMRWRRCHGFRCADRVGNVCADV